MLPSALAAQLTQGARDFLRHSFASTTPGFAGAINGLIADAETPLWRGPYVSLRLPFSAAAAGEGRATFPGVVPPMPPHRHQALAWARLFGPEAQSTLVATGTGSGKTECFLWPVLAHCLAERAAGRPGIKAILLYPMNALATDQAGRIARDIWRHPALKGKVTAGLYIGEDAAGRSERHAEMGEDHLVTDRATMQKSPPDILLTNYKMLDYLLLRAEDQGLWSRNAAGALRYLVVDELHTFDGAQGTDLACLIRRVKHRLGVTPGQLVCVGTSATLGGEGTAEALLDYARAVFGEPFAESESSPAVIAESRRTLAAFLEAASPEGVRWVREPEVADLPALDPIAAMADYGPERTSGGARLAWLRAQIPLWFDGAVATSLDPATPTGAVALGRALCGHATFRELMAALVEAPGALASLDELAATLGRARGEFRKGAADAPSFGHAALNSLLGLVSAARSENPLDPAKPRPFLEVRLQLWQRELSRVVAEVASPPRLRLADDLDAHALTRHLPAVHCRDCGAMGWAARADPDAPSFLRTELSAFYRDFFSGREEDARIRFLFPAAAAPHLLSPAAATRRWLDTELVALLEPGATPAEGQAALEVVLPECRRKDERDRIRLDRDCPFCGAQASLALVGFRAATLTSAQIDQLFGSRFNADKKLLAFSDSVQDAAHRAGFFGARTWQATLRGGFARWLGQQPEGVSLAAAPERFARDERARLGDMGFVSAYLPPSMDWLQDWEQARASGVVPPPPPRPPERPAAGPEDDRGQWASLPDLVTRRLRWELVAQAGLQASIGRSLIATHVMAVAFDRVRLEAAVGAALEPLRNEVAGLRTLSRDMLRSFVLGLLHLMRERGAIDHAELPEDYRRSRGEKLYLLNRRVHLPKYGRSSRLPRFLTDRGGGGRGDACAGTVYLGWFRRALTDRLAFELTDKPTHPYAVLLPHLVRAGLLTTWEADSGAQVWGLNDQAMVLTPDVSLLVCSSCGNARPVAEREAAQFHDVSCIRTGCAGTLRLESGRAKPDYFGNLFLGGDGQRVFAAEHTALVPRDRREETERSFKARPLGEPNVGDRPRQPWDVNLLSCTPTLEMGIDIGDLSSVFLCGVPRGQANYVQRVGRAGRRDGNAFVLTVAAARPHDRYFFESPEEMMAGAVSPPGVFLGAVRVLERQLRAFCLDRWVQAGEGKHALPPQMRKVFARLPRTSTAKAAPPAPHLFPEGLVDFVQSRAKALLGQFVGLFDPPPAPALVDVLRTSLEGETHGHGDFGYELINLLQTERRQRDALFATARAATKRAEALRAAAAKPQEWEREVEALEQEAEAHERLVEGIDGRSALEFLVERGWLPNYAFPEDAVTLRSIILRRRRAPEKRKNGRMSTYDARTFEYQRAPAMALTELAPDAEFFAEGRRVRITRVDLKSQQMETWRLCSECSHAAPETTSAESPQCPACQSPRWADTGQRYTMVRLTQVEARTPDPDSRIRDDADERTPRKYERRMFVDARKSGDDIAFRAESPQTPFGFELLRSVEFREINFGQSAEAAEKRRIAGREAPHAGFRLCRHCGVVLRKVERRGEVVKHDFGCKHFATAPADVPSEDVVEALYLYRSFRSEAVRLLLPLSEFAQDLDLESLRAALRLGLRRFFRGRVDHVEFTVDSEPVADSVLRRLFLVMYDAVPGGTSYLRQLVEPFEGAPGLVAVLRHAHAALNACPCRPGEDGCYRCLRAATDSGGRRPVSKRAALEVLGRLLEAADAGLVRIPTLSEISVDALMDSVLEARFIHVLGELARRQGDGSRVEKTVVGGIQTTWRIFAGARSWDAVAQVDVGPDDGVAVPSRPDFVLHPTAPAAGERPIAVFLDGWEHHHDRIGRDLAQRMALQDSGRFDTWSFTWQDIDDAVSRKAPAGLPSLWGVAPDALDAELRKTNNASEMGALSRNLCVCLWDRLRAPVESVSAGASAAAGETLLRLMCSPQPPRVVDPLGDLSKAPDAEAVRSNLKVLLPMALVDTFLAGQRGVFHRTAADARVRIRVAARTPREGFRAAIWLDDTPVARATGGYRDVWRAYLRFHHVLRDVLGVVFVTSERDAALEDSLLVIAQSRAAPAFMGWAEDFDWPADCRALAQALSDAGAPEPEQGADIPDARGRSWAEAELAYPDLKVAVLRRTALARVRGDAEPGWTIVPADAPDAISRLLSALGRSTPGEAT
jgi:DEAD/DEAH box helicase domain-containing protein